jgi:hypothetical protein
MARLFGRKKEDVPMGEVPLPPPDVVEKVVEPERVQVLSYFEIQELQLLAAVLDEQRKAVALLEKLDKKTEE